MPFFNKKKTKKVEPKDPQKIFLKDVKYSPKIILAWAKAIEGNKKINKWLIKNGYLELSVAVSAICLKNDARNWLMSNGYAHIMAMINASEGDVKAQNWLLKNNMLTFFHIAMAVESENKSWKWIGDNCGIEIFLLAKSIKTIKDKIEENHNDIHSYGKDI